MLPSESYKWHYLENTLRGVAATFNFREIRFPAFEYTELFVRGVGDTTDVVQKEMYTFEDKGGRSITLRPEGTASVVRSLIESGAISGALPVKCYYIAPNFRYEKPAGWTPASASSVWRGMFRQPLSGSGRGDYQPGRYLSAQVGYPRYHGAY